MARARAFQDIFASFTAQNLDMFGPANIDVVISGMQDFNSYDLLEDSSSAGIRSADSISSVCKESDYLGIKKAPA